MKVVEFMNHQDLLTCCKNKDAKAQRMLYDLFKGKLMGQCRRYARNREDAQDILQESFIKIFSKINQLKEVEKLEPWMKSIAIRTAIDFYHKAKSHETLFQKMEDGEHERSVNQVALSEATDEFILDLIGKLPDGCRLVFNLFGVEGYSHVEIADILNISEGTSRSQLHRAKQLLQEKLKCHSLASYYERLA